MFWLKIMPGSGFIFFVFFCYFFRNFLARVEYERISGLKFLFSFSAYLLLFWLKILPGRGFTIFCFFYYFFRNFLAQVEYERNSGIKFCFHFFCLSHPVLAKNNAGKRFYNFFDFFTILFGIFLPGSSMNGIRD